MSFNSFDRNKQSARRFLIGRAVDDCQRDLQLLCREDREGIRDWRASGIGSIFRQNRIHAIEPRRCAKGAKGQCSGPKNGDGVALQPSRKEKLSQDQLRPGSLKYGSNLLESSPASGERARSALILAMVPVVHIVGTAAFSDRSTSSRRWASLRSSSRTRASR